MSHKLGICIPYRNRKEHIERLIPHLSKHLNEKGIEHSFYVGHQVDDKLFNRGAMKNIAAHYAFEDGCDYIAWHDVDMLPQVDADYSYPEEHPIHIATKLSKYGYKMGYDQYFGGVVLFTKEQAYKTNGYSNDYWDWGQEDDDLFWRCYFEQYTTNNVFKKYKNKHTANFNGINNFIIIPTNKEIDNCLNDDHTISILFNAEQQPEKVPVWLVGDEEKKFIEYPLIRKYKSWTWGLSFNNSRSVNMVTYDIDNNHYYNYAKRYENQWTWVTMSYNKERGEMSLYINDELITNQNGVKENKPFKIDNKLKSQNNSQPIIVGFCPHINTFFRGKIAEVRIFNKSITDIDEALYSIDGLVLHMDFKKGVVENINKGDCEFNVTLSKENIDVVENIIPFRKEGNFDCMEHIDEGYVNGKWAKGETTAKNEKRFVMEMQQGLIKHKEEGLNNILKVLDIENIDVSLYRNTKFINVKMK
jgi:hypothetical protein